VIDCGSANAMVDFLKLYGRFDQLVHDGFSISIML
jgi:hypothetical protein